jgi:hypothetical protein
MKQHTQVATWVWLAVAIPLGAIYWSAVLTGGNPFGVAFIMAAVVGVWVMPPIMGHKMMTEKGRSGGAGIALGILLGWIGVLIVACLSTDPVYALRVVREEG